MGLGKAEWLRGGRGRASAGGHGLRGRRGGGCCVLLHSNRLLARLRSRLRPRLRNGLLGRSLCNGHAVARETLGSSLLRLDVHLGLRRLSLTIHTWGNGQGSRCARCSCRVLESPASPASGRLWRIRPLLATRPLGVRFLDECFPFGFSLVLLPDKIILHLENC